MKRLIVSLLAVLCVFILSGCGRSSEFGVVDMGKVEKEGKQIVVIKEEGIKELEQIEKDLNVALKGQDDSKKEEIIAEYRAKAQIVQSNMSGRIRNQLERVIHQVAQQKKLGAVLLKEAVPDGGIDITADVLEQLK